MKIYKNLFPCLTQFWHLNTLEKSGVGFGNRQMTLAGFATRKYVSPSHVDVNDSRYTLGIRFYRGPQEPDDAYQFCYTTAQMNGTDVPGIVIEQPAGTIELWEGSNFEHASSCDKRQLKEDEECSSTGVVLTQKPLMLNQTNRHSAETQEVADTVNWFRVTAAKAGVLTAERMTAVKAAATLVKTGKNI